MKSELLASTQRSVDRGTFGAPTFFVGDEMFFGKDRLQDVEDAIVASIKHVWFSGHYDPSKLSE